MSELSDSVSKSAAEFSHAMTKLAGLYEQRFGDVIRKCVLDLFAGIIRRSPVDTGSYRASHMIANHEPSPDEGVVKFGYSSTKSGLASTSIAMEKVKAWTWKPGDGTIYIFNNLPYAEPLENGHSKQAPQGIYRQAMTEVESVIQKQLLKIKMSGLFK